MGTLIAPWREDTQHARTSLARSWREFLRRAKAVLTRSFPNESTDQVGGAGAGLVAANLCVERDRIIVSMVLPGTIQEELEIDIDKDRLIVSGEWRVEQESGEGIYRVVRCAYRRFRRKLALPHQIDVQGSQVNLLNGVLRIDMPRVNQGPGSAT